jgi:hypothetical protein
VRLPALIAGLLIIVGVLLDAFETIVLPRRVQRSFRITSVFYRNTWVPWVRLASAIGTPRRKEQFLSYFGPLSLLALLGVWAAGLIFGFATLQWGLGGHVKLANEPISFPTMLYQSGETFFTLGYGDIVPTTGSARVVAAIEAGMGFVFLALVIGYLPIIYQSFSRREVEISLLDSRAGSPPTAMELLNRLGCCPDQSVLDQIFRDWERWSAEVLESHLSYPALVFFRSQHGNQSWLGALTLMLDVTSLVIAGIETIRPDQAKLTFAMARHAAVDLSQVVNASYSPNDDNRLSQEDLQELRHRLAENGLKLRQTDIADQKLAKLRSLYEPYVEGIARNLQMDLPSWMPKERKKDNWQTGPWDKLIQRKGLEEAAKVVIDEHF